MKKILITLMCCMPLFAWGNERHDKIIKISNDTKKSMVFVVEAPSDTQTAEIHLDVKPGQHRTVDFSKISKKLHGHWSRKDWFKVKGNKYGFGPGYTSTCYIKKSVLNSSGVIDLKFEHKSGPLGGHGTCLCPKNHMNVTCFKDIRCLSDGAEHKLDKCKKHINPRDA